MKKIVISILAIMALCCTLFSVAAFADGESATLVTPSSYDLWQYGTTVSLPSNQLQFAGETQDANVLVTYPDGKTTTTESTFVLTMEGNYVVEYSAQFTGGTQKVEETVVVKKPLYYTKNGVVELNSTYKYSDHAAPSVASTNAVTKNSSVTGLKVALPKGDVFEYGKVIDLKGKTTADILIKLAITPEEIGTADVSSFQIILTDVYNPNNYIIVETRSQQSPQSINYVASWATWEGAEGETVAQLPTGFNWNGNVSKYIVDNGTVSRFNLAGLTEASRVAATNGDAGFKPALESIADNAFALSMNYAEGSLHNVFSPHSGAYSATDGITNRYGKKSLLADLNDPTHYDVLWKGFTTGECFLSIKADGYAGSAFNFVITEISGQDVSSDAWDVTDRGNSQVEVLTGAYGDTLPNAMLGREYKLFDAVCGNQYYGDLEVIPEVTHEDGTTAVVTNGKFLAEKEGVYTIKYVAKNYFGVPYTKTFTITCLKESDVPAHVIQYVNENEVEKAGIAGVYVDLAEVTTTGGLGIPEIVAKVTCGNEVLEVKDNRFFPTHAGIYNVVITSTDHVGSTDSIEYDVEIGTGDKPVYLSTVVVPKYFISGTEYKLPTINAYDYTDGSGTPVQAKIAYVDANGVKFALGNTIKPMADQYTNTVDVIYYTDSFDAEGNIIFADIPLVDIYGANGKIDLTKMFDSNGITFAAAAANTTAKFNADAKATYINPRGANGLELRFKGVAEKANYEHFVITLTDYENPSQQVRFYYSPNGSDKTTFRINSLDSAPFEAGQALNANDRMGLKLDTYNKLVQFDVNSSTKPKIETYLNGETFNGFSSRKVYVEYQFIGVRGESEIVIESLSGQAITNRSNNAAPTSSIEGEYMGFKSLGDVARIPFVLFTDALDPEVVGAVTVKLPNGSYATAEDGTYLYNAPCDKDYFLKTTTYGSYVVSFTATDSMGKTADYSYLLNVMDETSPEIILQKTEFVDGVVGQKMTLPSAVAYDNVDGQVKVFIFVESTMGQLYRLNEEDEKGNQTFKLSFTPNKAGVWRAVYVARDSVGNQTIEIYEFQVKNA